MTVYYMFDLLFQMWLNILDYNLLYLIIFMVIKKSFLKQLFLIFLKFLYAMLGEKEVEQ